MAAFSTFALTVKKQDKRGPDPGSGGSRLS